MHQSIKRRSMLTGAAALTAILAFGAQPAAAQDKTKLRFSAVFSEKDIRAKMTQMFAEAISANFTLEPYYGGNLFKQGTELVAFSAAIWRWAISRHRTSPTSFRPGRS